MEALFFFRAMFVIGGLALIGVLWYWRQMKKNSKRSRNRKNKRSGEDLRLPSDALEYLPVNDDPVVLAKIREGDRFARTVEKYATEYVENNYSDEDFDLSFSEKTFSLSLLSFPIQKFP